MALFEELKEEIERYFREAEEGGFEYRRIEWELDNMVYPYIGSFLASGELSREEAEKLFIFCEKKLTEFRESL